MPLLYLSSNPDKEIWTFDTSFLSLIFNIVPRIFFWTKTNPDGHIMLYIS